MRDRTALWLAFVALLVSTTQASGTWWVHDPGDVGDWFEVSNWSDGMPTNVAYINNGGTALIAEGTATATTAYVGYDALNVNKVVQTGGSFSGSTAIYQRLQLGDQPGTHGEYDLSGDSYLEAWQIMLGDKGTGVFRQSDGTVNASVFTAMNDGATGIYEMSGGILNAPFFEMSGQGYGRFTQTDGTVTSDYFHVGYSFGEARFELHGGTVTADFFSLGTGYTWNSPIPPAYGTGILTDSAQLTAETMSIGGYGPGEFTQTGGTLLAQDDLYVAFKIEGLGTGSGKYRIEGGTATANNVHVGHGGQGSFEIVGSDGVINIASYEQTSRGRLVSEISATGLSTIEVTGTANVDGVWEVLDAGAPFGRYDVLTADAGITTTPGSILLPGPEWTWGIDAGTTLWVEHVPEPTSLSLLGVGTMAMLSRIKLRSYTN